MHKSSIEKGIVSSSGIDIDARWAIITLNIYFGYELHLTSITTAADLVIPLTADVTTANVQDNKMYVTLTSSSYVFFLPSIRYITANPEYDDKKLYEYSKKTSGLDLICPIERYEITFKKMLELVDFMNLK